MSVKQIILLQHKTEFLSRNFKLQQLSLVRIIVKVIQRGILLTLALLNPLCFGRNIPGS